MMKFNSLDDYRLFLAEIGRLDLLESMPSSISELSPTDDLIEAFFSKRSGLIKKVKDFRKSQNTKASWRKNRYQIMKGIKKFHRSIAGKKMHRSMGNFLATRDFSGNKYVRESNDWFELSELIKSLSSLCTHIMIECSYFRPMSEEIEFQLMAEQVLPEIFKIKESIVSCRGLSEDQVDLIVRFVEPKFLISECLSIASKSEEEITKEFEDVFSETGEDTSFTELLNQFKQRLK